MNRIVGELTQVTVIIAEESPRQPGVARLLEQSDIYQTALYPAESNHLVDVSTLEKSGVTFLVARHEGAIVGCCALVDGGEEWGEIKRMFVDPQARGLRIGWQLLQAIEAQARESGLTAIRLETGIYQPEAIGLYRKAGYVEIGPYGDYGPDPLSLFMEKKTS